LAEIERLKLDGKVAVYFNGCNLDELICMIRDELQFTKCRSILQFSKLLCSSNIYLDDNWRHMQRSIADYLQVNPPKPEFDSARIFSFIRNAKGYKEVSKDDGFLRFRDHIDKFKQDWLESATDTCSRIKGTESLRDEHLLSETKQKLWEACTIHYRLPNYGNRLQYDTAYNRIPAVRYFIDTQMAYYERTLKQGTTPKKGDYFDLEYAIYLDVMDYFITNDRGLKSLYDFASDEIGEACVLLKDVSGLGSAPPRAPNRERLVNVPFRVVKQ